MADNSDNNDASDDEIVESAEAAGDEIDFFDHEPSKQEKILVRSMEPLSFAIFDHHCPALRFPSLIPTGKVVHVHYIDSECCSIFFALLKQYFRGFYVQKCVDFLAVAFLRKFSIQRMSMQVVSKLQENTHIPGINSYYFIFPSLSGSYIACRAYAS